MKQLGLHEFLKREMPTGKEEVPWSLTALILVVSRLCEPSSELYIAEHFYRQTALCDLLGVAASKVDDNRLYRGLDEVLPLKEKLEVFLKERFGSLFGIEYDLLLDAPDFKKKLPFIETQFNNELDPFVRTELRGFCEAAEIVSSQLHTEAHNAVCNMREMFRILPGNHVAGDNERQMFNNFFARAKIAIRSLPCEDVGTILPGESPLASYRRFGSGLSRDTGPRRSFSIRGWIRNCI